MRASQKIETAQSSFRESLNRLYEAVVEIKLVSNPELDKEQVSKLRSEHMHQAANNSYKTKGVWKIGDYHVEDIKSSHGTSKVFKIKYNLVTASEFYDALENYKACRDFFLNQVGYYLVIT